LAEIPREDQRPRRTLIIVEDVSALLDRRLWSEATALARAHYEVAVICPKRRKTEATEETVDGIRVFRHPLPFRAPTFLGKVFELPIALFWEFVLSIKIARRYGFDVLHICNPPNIIFLIGAIFKIFGRKSVLFDFRDAVPQQSDEKTGNRGSLVERLAFKTADLSLTINEPHRQIAISHGMPVKRAVVLRPCPDPERVTRRQPDALWRNSRASMVAYAGEVSKAEGLDLLMSTIDYIVHQEQRADIQFVIAGSGPEWHEIASLCGKMDLGDYVTFTGAVDDDTFCTILSTADVCVDPRRVTPKNTISTSQKIMEYMAIGKPIVQFDMVEGRLLALDASRYAQENDAIDFGKHILELLDSPEVRKIMSDFGQQRFRKELSWQREQQKLLLAYDLLFAIRAQRLAKAKQQKGPKTRNAHISKPR
jgi:glycosyltransferase involved in cell wall biosynthesis